VRAPWHRVEGQLYPAHRTRSKCGPARIDASALQIRQPSARARHSSKSLICAALAHIHVRGVVIQILSVFGE
jgi:hypothetical protein